MPRGQASNIDGLHWTMVIGAWLVASIVVGVLAFYAIFWLGALGYALFGIWTLLVGRSSWRNAPTGSRRRSRLVLTVVAMIAVVVVAYAGIRGLVWTVKDCAPFEVQCPD